MSINRVVTAECCKVKPRICCHRHDTMHHCS